MFSSVATGFGPSTNQVCSNDDPCLNFDVSYSGERFKAS